MGHVADFPLILVGAITGADRTVPPEMRVVQTKLPYPSLVLLTLFDAANTGQLWLAEPDGGWHFDLKNGLWIDDKRGLELTAAIEKALGDALGMPVNLALA